ncbi:MAG: hypothetical protein AAFY76_11930, partial [Cyanobacteria bacterium J06649_11]
MKEFSLKLISKGDIDGAIDSLFRDLRPETDSYAALISVSSRYHELKRRQKLGIILDSELDVLRNKVSESLVEIVRNADTKDFLDIEAISVGDSERIENTKLFHRLRVIEEGNDVSNQLIRLIEDIQPEIENREVLILINEDYGLRTLEIIDKILPQTLIDKLNEVELSLLIISSLFYKSGFILSVSERDALLQAEDFTQYMATNNFVDDTGKQNFARDKETQRLEFNYDVVSFLSSRQPELATSYLRKYFEKSEFSYFKPLYTTISEIIRSQNVFTYDLLAKNVQNNVLQEVYPIRRILNNKEVNVRFLCLCLKVGYYLSFPYEETPRVLFEHIASDPELTFDQWSVHSHQANLFIDPLNGLVSYNVECIHPIFQYSIIEMLTQAKGEIERCNYLIQETKNLQKDHYNIKISEEIETSGIIPRGYIYGDFKFKLDFERIMGLLTGEFIYDDHEIALRELLQNSVDACRHRK